VTTFLHKKRSLPVQIRTSVRANPELSMHHQKIVNSGPISGTQDNSTRTTTAHPTPPHHMGQGWGGMGWGILLRRVVLFLYLHAKSPPTGRKDTAIARHTATNIQQCLR